MTELARRVESRAGLRWMVTVRWGAAVTQVVATVTLGLLGGSVPLAPALACVLPVAASNAWLARRIGSRPPSETQLFGLLLLDVTLLSAWLVLAGGPSNPWSALYLVYVVLASLLLERGLPWGTVAASGLGYGITFALSPGGEDAHAGHGGGAAFDAHLEGMYVAYVVSSVLVAYFVTRVADELRRRDHDLAEARERAARVERIAALTTLAAGAAHELGSPLATIAVAAKELERSLAARDELRELAEDARLVREEVVRCRTILDRMAQRAGAFTGEAPVERSLASAIDTLAESLGPERFARVKAQVAAVDVRLPRGALDFVLENLVRNALDASPAEADVELHVGATDAEIRVVVHDRGHGMDEATRRRALDPFFTTKDPGRGMGLGLFLVEALTHELGGSLEIDSAPGVGTTVTLVLPRSPVSLVR